MKLDLEHSKQVILYGNYDSREASGVIRTLDAAIKLVDENEALKASHQRLLDAIEEVYVEEVQLSRTRPAKENYLHEYAYVVIQGILAKAKIASKVPTPRTGETK